MRLEVGRKIRLMTTNHRRRPPSIRELIQSPALPSPFISVLLPTHLTVDSDHGIYDILHVLVFWNTHSLRAVASPDLVAREQRRWPGTFEVRGRGADGADSGDVCGREAGAVDGIDELLPEPGAALKRNSACGGVAESVDGVAH